jgi:hypothetical protein
MSTNNYGAVNAHSCIQFMGYNLNNNNNTRVFSHAPNTTRSTDANLPTILAGGEAQAHTTWSRARKQPHAGKLMSFRACRMGFCKKNVPSIKSFELHVGIGCCKKRNGQHVSPTHQ